MSVRPTEFARRIAMSVAYPTDARVRFGVDFPDPEDVTKTRIYCQISMIGGDRDRFEQSPEFDISFFAQRYVDAEAAAFALEAALVRYPMRVQVGGKSAVLDRAEVTSATCEVPWETDPSVTRFIGTYSLLTRS